ncbi:MAG: hypothetical protein VX589_03425 [Myxococcota bacterium]|nr:hypothetical protein [Myxococcota bacterium]
MIILASKLQQYFEIKSAVEAKWDIIAMLCLLVFFLTVVIVTYAVIRPYYIVAKVLTLVVAFSAGYGVAYVAVHKGLAPEFYKLACTDMMERLNMTPVQASAQCQAKNPIKLSRVKAI